MSLTATTLSGAINATQTQIALTSGTGVTVGTRLRVDEEKMEVQALVTATVFMVRRGIDSKAVAHDALAPAVHGTAADFPPVPEPNETSYGQDGAIAIAPGKVSITKGSAAALTLADPTQAQNGLTMVFTSRTAFAHVITGVNIWDGTATVNTTLTFANVVGASITLQAQNGAWNVISLNAVTPAP